MTLLRHLGTAAILTLAMSTSALAVDKAAVSKASSEYRKIGNEIMPNLKAGKLDAKEAEAKIDAMVAQAHVVMKEYAGKFPESKKLIDFLIGQTGTLKGKKFVELEKDYHDAAALTKDKVGIDLKDESNEKFLDPCHILVHPLMVLAAVREGKASEGVAELNEGMEQMKTSETELTK